MSLTVSDLGQGQCPSASSSSSVVQHKKQCTLPGILPNSGVTESFDTLVKHHTNKLMIFRLHFFKYIASILRLLLLQFQTSKQMILFLAVEFDVTLRQLTCLVEKSKVVSDANTPYLLLQLDLGKIENLSDIDKVELGSAVTSALANLKVKEEVKLKFRKDCAVIVLKSIVKIKEKCPLKYLIVRNAVCLSPLEMIHNADPSIARAKRDIQSLYELNSYVSQKPIRLNKSIYLKFMNSVVVTNKEKFLLFGKDKDFRQFYG